jgi:hypothetical protein
MRAEKPAGVRYGTEALALGGFTETLPKRTGEEHGGNQAAILNPREISAESVRELFFP